jgi:hypothetical protein
MKGPAMIRLTLPLALIAAPAAAHDLTVPHAHSDDPVWLIALFFVAAVGVAALIWHKSR